jgi:hypothetical protein
VALNVARPATLAATASVALQARSAAAPIAAPQARYAVTVRAMHGVRLQTNLAFHHKDRKVEQKRVTHSRKPSPAWNRNCANRKPTKSFNISWRPPAHSSTRISFPVHQIRTPPPSTRPLSPIPQLANPERSIPGRLRSGKAKPPLSRCPTWEGRPPATPAEPELQHHSGGAKVCAPQSRCFPHDR